MPLGRKPVTSGVASDVTGFMMGGRRLVLLKNGVAEKAYTIGMEPFGIGRDKTNHIAIEDGLASKFHARIIPKQGRVEAQDVESRNGTRVNERLMAMQWLNPGDVIRIGRTCFIFLMEGMPLKRRPEDVTGWLKSCDPGGGPSLPVTQFPLLFGKAPEADQPVPGVDAHFHTQIVAIPGGAQVTNLAHDPPHVSLLIEGSELTIGRHKFAYHAAHGEIVRPASDASVMRMLEEEAERVDRAVAMPSGLDPAAAFAIAPHKVGGCHITGTKGSLTGKTFSVTDRSLIVGSDPNCDVVINNRAVSKRHARLNRKEGEPVIEDISNTIGVYVNGVRIHRHPLKPGDIIAIATEEFMVHL